MAAIEKVPDASRSTSGIKLCWVQKCTETTTDADGSISYCSRSLRCSFSWSPVFLNLLSWISSVLVLWFSPTFVHVSDVRRKQPTNNSWLAVDAVGNGIEKERGARGCLWTPWRAKNKSALETRVIVMSFICFRLLLPCYGILPVRISGREVARQTHWRFRDTDDRCALGVAPSTLLVGRYPPSAHH